MNSEVPVLPIGLPAEGSEAEIEQQPVISEEAPQTPAAPESEAREARSAPPTPSPASPAGPPVPGIPGAPGMPAMPGDDDPLDDDDFEIPEDVGYPSIVKTRDRGPRGRRGDSSEPLKGVIVGKRGDGFFVDIGRKSEAFLPLDPEPDTEEELEVGQALEVLVIGQSKEGYALLTKLHGQRPRGWAQLEAAYRSGSSIVGRVSGTIKGGLSVDVGVRAFMPASRSGERTEQGLQSLVGTQVHARIVQFDEADRNVVLDRRVLLEEERAKNRERILAELKRGDRVVGTVRTLRKFGAFVDLGGIDGLLHVSDISWQRINDPADVLSIGQELEVEILKVDQKLKRIGVGLKQLQPEPWSTVGDHFKANDRVRGTVTRLKEYGAFVEVLPGIEGLVHISDMSYSRRVRHPSEIVKPGDVVEVMVLDVKAQQKRIALGLKQAMGDPWERLVRTYSVGSPVTGTVRRIVSFGAFVEIVDGVDGLLHISDITSERRLNSPAEVLREGTQVRVKILEIDTKRRRLKVGMKQLEPTELEMFLSQVEVGETLSGRVVETRGNEAIVEIGSGVRGVCPVTSPQPSPRKGTPLGQTSDLSSLKSMLESAWKGGPDDRAPRREEPLTQGSVHSFRVTRVDAENRAIELARA